MKEQDNHIFAIFDLCQLRFHFIGVKTTFLSQVMSISDTLGLSREDTHLSSRLEGIGSDPDDQSEYNQSERSSTASRHSSALLEGDVISRLTRTLPETLMIKANQNINKIIDKRKQRMLKKARDSSSRDIMQDPRWQKLESALSDKFTCE